MKIGVEAFSLEHTLDSGQFFRYDYREGWYYCQERDKLFRIRQAGNIIEFEGTDKTHIKRLFGLNQNYDKIIEALSKDKTLLPAIKKYHGLRVMQRDPWETLVSFQCSIFSNIKKIKLNMNCIAKEFGNKILPRSPTNFSLPLAMRGERKMTLAEAKARLQIVGYAFPAPGKINNLERIKKCATGFRAKYIYGANKIVSDAYFEALRKKTYKKAKEQLMQLPGIGEKVADCICLFSLGKTEAFPVDVWMERVMTKLYKKKKNRDIKTFAQERWGKNAGYAQQFLYHWVRHK